MATNFDASAADILCFDFCPDTLVCDESGQCLEAEHVIAMTMPTPRQTFPRARIALMTTGRQVTADMLSVSCSLEALQTFFTGIIARNPSPLLRSQKGRSTHPSAFGQEHCENFLNTHQIVQKIDALVQVCFGSVSKKEVLPLTNYLGTWSNRKVPRLEYRQRGLQVPPQISKSFILLVAHEQFKVLQPNHNAMSQENERLKPGNQGTLIPYRRQQRGKNPHISLRSGNLSFENTDLAQKWHFAGADIEMLILQVLQSLDTGAGATM